MIAVRLISQEELVDKLKPYGCRKIREISGTFELWETGWGEPFTIMPCGGPYDFWSYTQILASVIAKTLPDDWEI